MSRNWLDVFRDAARGLQRAVRTQRNLRLHLFFALAALTVALALGLPPAEVALVALAIGLVLVAELLNSALEALVDLVTGHDHPLARAAKDIAAGAVLVAAMTALVCAWLVFSPRLRAALPLFTGTR